MRYDSTTVSQVAGVAFASDKNKAIISVNVKTDGSASPLPINALTFNTNGTSTYISLIDNARLFYTKKSNIFDTLYEYGQQIAHPFGSFSFTDTLHLAGGDNFFWLTYDINEYAQSLDSLDGECETIEVDNNLLTVNTPNPPGALQLGLMYRISSTTNPDFSTSSLTTNESQWKIGKPSVGPLSGYKDSICWGTTLNGTLQADRSFVLSTPSYITTSTNVYISYQQWYDFTNTSNPVLNSFEYEINGVWTKLQDLDIRNKYSTNNQWKKTGITIQTHVGDTIKFRWVTTTAVILYSCLGWFIDEVMIGGVATFNQSILSTTAFQNDEITVAGGKQITALGILLKTVGSDNKLVIDNLELEFSSLYNTSIISGAKVFYTGNSSKIDTTNLFGTSNLNPLGVQNISGSQALLDGDNYFWVVIDVDTTAISTDIIDVNLLSVWESSNAYTPLTTNPSGAIYIGIKDDYEAAADDYYTITHNTIPSHWQRGVPTTGPSAYSGNKCWATNLNGGFVKEANYSLVSTPYLVNSTNAYIKFAQWFNFFLALRDVSGHFDVKINSNDWINLYTISDSSRVSSGGIWEHVVAKLPTVIGDTVILRWNFKSGAYAFESDGWYIDDLHVVGLNLIDQDLLDATLTRLNDIAFPNSKNVPVAKAAIQMIGNLNPQVVTKFNFNAHHTTSLQLIDSVYLYSTGVVDQFNSQNLIGKGIVTPSGDIEIISNHTLKSGTNNFWLTYDVSSTALMNDLLSAELISFKTNVGFFLQQPNSSTSGVRVGRLYHFDTTSNEDFYTENYNPVKPNGKKEFLAEAPMQHIVAHHVGRLH
jgi:hypothetical protein